MKRSKKNSGQVVAEYAAFLALTLILLLALVFLMRAIGEHGELSVERVSYAAP